MYPAEAGQDDGPSIFQCPVCGHEEKQYGKLATVQEPEPNPKRTVRAVAPSTTKTHRVAKIEPGRMRARALVEMLANWWDGGAPAKQVFESIREWWDGGEGLVAILENLSEEDEATERPVIPVRRKLRRKAVSIDRERAELRVDDGPPIPFAGSEVFVFRRNRNLREPGWMGVGRPRSENNAMWVYGVHVRHGNHKTFLAEFGTRAGAEKCANELREEMALS